MFHSNQSKNHQQNFLLNEAEKSNKIFYKPIGVITFLLRLSPYFILTFLGLFFVLVVSLFAALSPYYNHLRSAYAYALSGQKELNQAQEEIFSRNFAMAEESFLLAKKSFSEAENNLKLIERSAVFRNDYLKDQLLSAQELLAIGAGVSESLVSLSRFASEAQNLAVDKNLNWQSLPEEKKIALLKFLQSSAEEFAQNKKHLALFNQDLSEVKRRKPLFIFDQAIQPLNQVLPSLEQGFGGLFIAAKYLPGFAGLNEEKNYLLLLLNNREMRPSGGFIGTYGLLKLKNADLKNLFIDNIYNFDKLSEKKLSIKPPLPIEKYMNQKKLFLRDSNWSPDFLASSLEAENFYKLEGGQEKLAGVIGLTVSVIEDLFDLTGEIQVGEMKFNKQNFYDQIQYEVEYGYHKKGIEMENRKDLIGELSQVMIEKLKNLPMSEIIKLFSFTQKQIKQKQLLAYFNNAELQTFAEKEFFAGRIRDTNGDYLAIIDANLAALKTDAVMTRTAIYNLTETKDSLSAELKINYQNSGDFSWKTTRYRSYSRYYLPLGSVVKEVKIGNKVLKNDEYDFGQELNKNFVGLFFEVEPKSSQIVALKYTLPKDIFKNLSENNGYSLLFQKQNGLPKINLQVNWQFLKSPKMQFNDLKFMNTKVIHAAEMLTDREFNFDF